MKPKPYLWLYLPKLSALAIDQFPPKRNSNKQPNAILGLRSKSAIFVTFPTPPAQVSCTPQNKGKVRVEPKRPGSTSVRQKFTMEIHSHWLLVVSLQYKTRCANLRKVWLQNISSTSWILWQMNSKTRIGIWVVMTNTAQIFQLWR